MRWNGLMRFAAKSLFAGAFGLTILARCAVADVITEKLWHPVAGAYRTAMFLADLPPPDWGKIAKAFHSPLAASASLHSAAQALDGLNLQADMAAIDQAIAAKETSALYDAATRMVAKAIIAKLDMAVASLDDPGKANARILEAQGLYRAFADIVSEADGENAKRLGRAWLDLTTSVGSAGVAGYGRIPAAQERFLAAATSLKDYIKVNYNPAAFAKRTRAAPIPDSVILAKGEIDLTAALPPGSDINDQDPLPRLVLNFEEQGIGETGLPLVAYGDMLFDSPEIFGKTARDIGLACSTCHNRSDINQRFTIPGVGHQPGAADVDGAFFNPQFNDRRADSLDIPSLRGLRFTAPYGRDGRMGSAREFTRNVIVNEFGGEEPTPYMLDALVAYMNEFDFLSNTKLTPDGKLAKGAAPAAKRGEMLFNTPFAAMDGKACASCHIPSGNFIDKRSHDIGSVKPGYDGSRDGALDTPTLLGAKFTAPYFHDGSLPTLASVTDWFDKRYGLKLTPAQKGDLTAYLETVGDADEPYQAFTDKETPFRLAFDELTTFASTLDTLIPKRDKFHADLMIRTVAADLKADASAITNGAAPKEVVYSLAGKLEGVREAIQADDWGQAASIWQEFKTMKEEHDASIY